MLALVVCIARAANSRTTAQQVAALQYAPNKDHGMVDLTGASAAVDGPFVGPCWEVCFMCGENKRHGAFFHRLWDEQQSR